MLFTRFVIQCALIGILSWIQKPSIPVFVVSMCIVIDRWIPAVGEIFMCEIEDRNSSDSYLVAIKEGMKLSDTCQEIFWQFVTCTWGLVDY